MIKIIAPENITFRARISEDELRERMELEVLEQIGGLDPSGQPRGDIEVKTCRGQQGGYTIDVSGPLVRPKLLGGAS